MPARVLFMGARLTGGRHAERITQKKDYISELQFNCVCDLMNMYLKEMQIIPEISSEE